MKLAICDDEEYYIHKVKCKLTESLRNHGIDNYQIETFLSGKELCSLGSGLSEYTVIFLDINMDELNGIEAAKIIRRYNKETLHVFITAFLEYAPEGYKVGAMRYILKDMLDETLPECMDAIIKKLKINTKKICYPFVEGKKEIYVDKIYYIESEKHKLIFNIASPQAVSYTLYDKLDTIAEELEVYGFLRIHKSYLVNMDYLITIHNYRAYMESGEELPVPRARYQMIKERFFQKNGGLNC